MLFQGHLLIGVLMFLTLKKFNFVFGNEFIFFSMVVLGALMPDLDEKNSKINRWSLFIGKLVVFCFKHRGIFHTVLFFGVLSLLIAKFWSPYYGFALFLGYCAHIIGDGITPMGVKIFYPLQWKIKGPIKVGSRGEKVITFCLIMAVGCMVWTNYFGWLF